MWLAPIAHVFWLNGGVEPVSLEELVPQLEALGHVASELDARLRDVGVGGLDGGTSLHERLGTVLDAVSRDDLERMARLVEAIRRELDDAARRIAALRELKLLLDGVVPTS